MKTILVVDDEPRTRIGIKKTLDAWSIGKFNVEIATSAIEALKWLENHSAHIIVTDICMPQIDGLQMLEQINDKANNPVVIVISGHADFRYAKRSLQLGVFEYLVKPIEKTNLIETIERALIEESSRERIGIMEKLVDPTIIDINMDEKKYHPLIQEALQYIDQHLVEDISMKHIATTLHINASYFSVLFKEQIGITFSEYITKARLQKAKQLLVTSHLSIGEIAEKVGYSTDKYFIKVFKESEGISPNTFRKSEMSTSNQIQ